MRARLFTSESVTEGHPDKVADQISDAVLDGIMEIDPHGRVAVETLVTTGLVVVAGEISTDAYVDVPEIVRDVVREIGYDDPSCGFEANTCGVMTSIQKQSPDIALGVDKDGAGDQGMMFGYATDETPELMPAAITYAHKITMALSYFRKAGTLPYLRPDGKSQVTVEYEKDGRVRRIHTVVISAHHAREASLKKMREDFIDLILTNHEVFPAHLVDKNTIIHVNPTGRFEVGGPNADTGLTGRKIICDTYGGAAPHGGGAFSGKDPTKVDRSAAYMARHIAKNVVMRGMAYKCEIQLAYAIGIAEPVSVSLNTFGTEKIPHEEIAEFIVKNFPHTPKGIIEHLDLRKPIYRRTSNYGHFGRVSEGFRWEMDVNEVKNQSGKS